MSKFKKGDEVILNNDIAGFCEGTFGTVHQTMGVSCFVKVSSDEGFWVDHYNLELIKRTEAPTPTAKVKSDGGSSSYYELTITNKNGESIKCETGDVIRSLVGNDFDLGNCVKALRRIYLSSIGQGKEGVDVAYDCNKVRYFIGEVERVNK